MRSFRDLNPYLVGLASLLVLGALTGTGFAVGTFNLLEDTYAMSGVFSDASGLRVGDDVAVAGVDVGRVTDIDADHGDGAVTVEWEVDRRVDVRDGVRAEIVLSSLLGSRELRLLDSTDGDRLLRSLPREQRIVPLERTAVPFDLFELTRQATATVEELDTEQLNELVVDLADISAGKAGTVDDLVEGITRIGAAVNDRERRLDALVADMDRLSATLADKDAEIVALIDASRAILDLLVARRTDLAAALGDSATAVEEIDRLISANEQQLDSVLDRIGPTLDVVAAEQDDLDRSLAWLGQSFLQQGSVASNGPWVDIFIRAIGPDVPGVLQDVYRLLLGVER